MTSDISWFKDAICKDRNSTYPFFGHHGEKPQAAAKREKEARIFCAKCPVIGACRQYARENQEHGFWGGETEEERFKAGFLYDPTMARRWRAMDMRKRERELREEKKQQA
jgi:hypothetical protein